MKLFDHQKHGIDFCCKQRDNGAGLFFDQGLGKTAVSLLTVDRLQKRGIRCSPLLVVCKASVIFTAWVNEARLWIPDWNVTPILGTRDKRREILKGVMDEDAYGHPSIAVINFEGFRSFLKRYKAIGRSGQAYWRYGNTIADNYPWHSVIIDELSLIKNGMRKQSKSCHVLSRVPIRMGLTGTPITKHEGDLWSQFRFLNDKVFGWSYRQFQARYIEMEQIWVPGGKQRWVPKCAKNVEELYARVAPYVLVKKKEECLDLPPKIKQQEILKLKGEQARAYKGLAGDMIADIPLHGTVSAPQMLARFTKLRQIVQGHIKLDDGRIVHFEQNAKRDHLEEFLNRVGPAQVIIWYQWREDVKNIEQAAGEPIARISGDVPITEREGVMELFQRGDRRIIACQFQCASYGITLTAGTYSYYYCQTWDFEHRQQSSDRIHRIGQTKTVFEIDPLAEGTIDLYMQEICTGKRKRATRFDRAMMRNVLLGKA